MEAPSVCEEMRLMPRVTKAKGNHIFFLALWYSSQGNDWLLTKEDSLQNQGQNKQLDTYVTTL